MPQFTPAPRDEVRAVYENSDKVVHVSNLGPGLMAAKVRESDTTTMFTHTAEEAGWYVASYRSDDAGDVFTLMPFGVGSD